MNIRFDKQVVIVTGAARGIGLASARLFAELGAQVVLSDIDGEAVAAAAEEIVDAGGRASEYRADVREAAEVDDLVTFAMRTYGRLDVMFNNAGGALPKPLLDTPAEQYRSIMALNLDAVYFGTMAALRVMVPQGGGCILTTTSGAGLRAQKNLAIYGAAKAAVINLMRNVAAEHGQQGIRANAISPGPMDTPGLQAWLGSLPGGAEAYQQQLPSGRLGTAQDIANAAVFLASEHADYINGVVLPVDGAVQALLATPHTATE